jgi:outer membrane protein assembly factor BamB
MPVASGGQEESRRAARVDRVSLPGMPDGKLYAINPDGTQKWAFATGDDVDSSPAIGADGTVYVGSYDNKLYAIGP